MKWTYKECEVEITAIYETSAKMHFTPLVEIDCRDTDRSKRTLTTNKQFIIQIEAELYGQRMAKERIDERKK